jgi:purine-binding chemotaxis protein CheW
MAFAETDLAAGPGGGAAELKAESRQFVTFIVEGRNYGIPIGAVREIIRWTRVTPLPNQPDHARGVLNLRGTIVPVYDLRARLSGRLTDATDTHVIVIANVGAQTLGILVDGVSDILNVAPDDLKAPPQAVDSPASQALVNTEDDRLVTILNLSALFGSGIDGSF